MYERETVNIESTHQRRGKRIAMTSEEVDQFLAEERTCRVATLRGDHFPHVTPLWFVWDSSAVWLNSLVSSQRWTDLQKDPRVGILIDGGSAYGELRGIEFGGSATFVGEVPRRGDHVEELVVPERLWSEKYRAGHPMVHDGKHGWIRVQPERVVSWDFRKMKVKGA
jgi:Pyridoxamine 5'-phosphate oxidase